MRVLNWEDIERMRRYRRELMKMELARPTKPKKRRPRPEEEVLKLARLAAEAFRAWYEVVECGGGKRVLRARF